MTSLQEIQKKIILKAEQLVKTDINYLIRGSSWLGSGQILTSFSAFLTALLFANLIPPETYGTYKYILSIGSIFTIFTLTGIDTAVTRAIARGFEGNFMLGLRSKFRWGIIAVIIGFLLSGYYYIHGNYTFAATMIIVGIGIPLMEGFDLYNSLLNGRKLYRKFTYYNVTTQILLTVFLGIVLVLSKNVIIIVAAYFFFNICLNLLFLILSLRNAHLSTKKDPEVITYAKHLSFLDILNILLNQFDSILVFHYLGATFLAIYTLAVAPTDQIRGLFKNLNFLAVPKFAARNTVEIKTGLFKKTIVLMIVISISVFGYIIISPIVFKIFFPKYLIAVHFSQVLAISLLGAVGANFVYNILTSKGATRSIYHYNIWTNIISFTTLLPMIYFFGIWGAITSRLITRFFAFALGYGLVMKMPEEPNI